MWGHNEKAAIYKPGGTGSQGIYWNIAVPLGREFSAAIAKIASEQKSDEEY